VTALKGGQFRVVNIAARPTAALEDHQDLRTRILTKDDGSGIDQDWTKEKMKTAQCRAGVEVSGLLQKLRHTFGAHHATAGTSVNTLKELMGHQDITTTMRYMYLSPAHKAEAASGLEKWRNRLGALVELAFSASPTENAGQKKAPPNLTLGGAQMVTPTGLEPMFST